MGKITLTVEGSGAPMAFDAAVSDQDTARLVTYYGARYGMTDTTEILRRWFQDYVIGSKADAVEWERKTAAQQAVSSIADISVTFS